jgi:hypothetical protein
LLIDKNGIAAPAVNNFKSNYIASGVLSFFSIIIDKDKAPSLLMVIY